VNRALKAILRFMLNKRYIGARHFPEERLMKSRTKWLSKQEFREFRKEYMSMIHCFRRAKKRTGRGSAWHISIDPRHLSEIEEMIVDV